MTQIVERDAERRLWFYEHRISCTILSLFHERNGFMDAQGHDISDAPRLLEALQALAPHIHDAADTIEADRRLPSALVRALKEAGVFRMAMPREYGGPALDPL